MDPKAKFTIEFNLLDAIVSTLLELPAKNSRIILNRIEKEVTAAPTYPTDTTQEGIVQLSDITK